jgi:N-acetylglucosamine-6-phosphate deacetylase
MAKLLLRDAVLVDPEAAAPFAGSLLIDGGRIAAVLGANEPGPAGVESRSLSGARLAPGFVDVHFHGALPAVSIDDAAAALEASSASLARHGVTAFLATTVAWPAPELAARIAKLAELLDRSDWPGAVPIGVHLEGPWIRPEAAGAQPPDGIRPYESREGAALFDRLGSQLQLVTLAPELEGSRTLERDLARRGVAVALGHTLAGTDAVAASVGNGACHVTHLFNAMGSRVHRGPRVTGTDAKGFAALALAEARLGCDLIADGAHVHPDWLRLAAETKRDRAILISDRIDVPPGSEGWLGAAHMRSDGVAWRLGDGRLAGSLLQLDGAVANVQRMRVMDFHDAVRACTVAPARLIGLERERGTLRVGARADLVALGADGAVLRTWIEGRERPVTSGSD